jgi:hypothetical protein
MHTVQVPGSIIQYTVYSHAQLEARASEYLILAYCTGALEPGERRTDYSIHSEHMTSCDI